VKEQNDKLKYALLGMGDIIVHPEYNSILVDPINFSKLTSKQKEKYLNQLDTFNASAYKKSLESLDIDLQIPGNYKIINKFYVY
jgi:hypothetical protein